MNNYKPIIGLEIHVELKTKSKMFCGCKNDPFHASRPNIYTCPVCLGLPGALPVPNRKAVEWTIMLGLALNCQIPLESKFDRKHYFYPDLPKGYQISQYDQPLAVNGWLDIKSEIQLAKAEDGSKISNQNLKKIGINRVHLEEDTGKLQHATIKGKKVSLIDFNRSGVPLVEIVTEPDITSAEEAKLFLKKLHQIIRYLGISEANMEQGSMRLEPNISVLPIMDNIRKNELPKYKVEVKNINSFKFAAKAIDFEIKRQIELLEKGETPRQETRGWDEKKGVTLPQRSKEEAHDYRYFPEPDIPPMHWKKEFIRSIKNQIPELPDVKLNRFIKDFGLPTTDAERLVENIDLTKYFEESLKYQAKNSTFKKITKKQILNWLLNKNINISKISPEKLLSQILASQQKVRVNEDELETVVNQILSQYPQVVATYKAGKTKSIMFFIGQAMKSLKGRGDPQIIRKLLEKKLE